MRHPRYFLFLFTLSLSFLGVLSGCMGIEKTNAHLASMDTSTQQLNRNFDSDQQYVKTTTEQMALMQKHMEAMEAELANDREYLKSVADCLKSMSESLAALRAMGDKTFATVLDALTRPTPDPHTKGIQELLPPIQSSAN